MSIRQLINGQTIEIDNHKRGELIIWDRSIHLHKRMNGDKYNGVDVIIPIAEYGELKFGNKVKSKKQQEIKNEIKDAFKTPQIRKEFIESFYKNLKLIFENSGIKDKEKQKELSIEASDRIAKYFRVKSKFTNEWGDIATGFFVEYELDDTESGNKNGNKHLYVRQNYDMDSLVGSYVIGTELEEVENF